MPTDQRPRFNIHWRRELMWLGIGLGLGLLVLPGLIYAVGVVALGAYGGGPHIGSFYGDFFRDTFTGSGRAIFLALSPYLAFWVIRAIFFRWNSFMPQGSSPPTTSDSDAPVAHPAPNPTRREPFIAP